MRPKFPSSQPPSAREAEAVALRALMWMAEDGAALAGLLAASGLAPAELRARAGEPEFLGFALDFVMEDEGRARAFAEAADLDPEALARARAALPGGDAPHWS